MSTTEPNSRGKIEVIPPATVHGRNEGVYQYRQKPPHLAKALSLIFALLVLLAGGGLLLHYLSQNPVDVSGVSDERVTSESKTDDETVEAPKSNIAPEPVKTTNVAKSALEKEDAEKKMTDFLSAKKALDTRGGKEWGVDLYAKMTRLGQEADAFFMNKAYASASSKYAEAWSTVNRLSLQSNEALGRLLVEGRLALSEGDGRRAANKFSVALMIDPGNELAHRSLERAKKIESVTRLIESGNRNEKQGNLPFALTDYREALELDPQSETARLAFARVKRLIAQDEFQQLMSAGFAALHNREHEVARAAFLKAQSFKPNSSEVQDALAQVDQAIRLARIEAFREKALNPLWQSLILMPEPRPVTKVRTCWPNMRYFGIALLASPKRVPTTTSASPCSTGLITAGMAVGSC